MIYLWYVFGTVLGVVALAVFVVALVALCGSIGMDGLFAAHEPRGELTCWHCGEQTRAGVRHCTHCGEELQ